jgi:hypothetical protein
MSTNIRNFSSNIDTNFPVQGRDNPSQGFRDNFAQIKLALITAADEISALEDRTSGDLFTITPATTATAPIPNLGGVIVGNGFDYNQDTGVISVGTVYTLPEASISTLGGVKIGDNIAVAPDGTISVATPYVLTTATGSVLGGVIIGAGLEIDEITGVVSVDTEFPFDIPLATPSVAGVVKIGANIAVDPDGTISVTTPYQLPAATRSAPGGVIIGAGVDVADDGTISVNTGTRYVLPAADFGSIGGVRIGSGITLGAGGEISIPVGSTGELGSLRVGDNITVVDGVISVAAPYVLPLASNITTGGIRIGNGLTIDESGYVNVSFPVATTSTLGAILGVVDTSVILGDRGNDWRPNGGFNVAIGAFAGSTLQQSFATAVGAYAGLENQGAFSVAIGTGAGQQNQPENSIVINASGGNLNADTSNALYISPIRTALSTNVLYYNQTTKEVSQGPVVLANYTTSTLGTIGSTSTGTIALVTDLPSGALPCFFDGTSWKTFAGTVI